MYHLYYFVYYGSLYLSMQARGWRRTKYQLKKKDLEEMCNDGIKIYTNMMNHIILRAKESVDIQSDQ